MSRKFLIIEAVVAAVIVALYCSAGSADRAEVPAAQSAPAPAQDGGGNTVELERPAFLGE